MEANTENKETAECTERDRASEMHSERLSKRMTYILRYGAKKEGLQVDESGFVLLYELLSVPLMARYTAEEILKEVEASQSHRGSKRFDVRMDNGRTLVRASYGRRLEKNPCHDDSKVFTLFESSVQTVLDNLGDYDFQDFPDDYLIGFMLQRLARKKRLNNGSLRVLLVPALEHLNLEDVFLTQNTLRMVTTQCPHLRSLSLRNCGYIVTDSVLSQITKKLGKLEFLNVTGCQHLTDACVGSVVRNLPRLARLGLSFNTGVTEAGVIRLLQAAPALKLLDVFGLKASQEARETIDRVRLERKIVVILKGLEEKDENGVKTHIKPSYVKDMM